MIVIIDNGMGNLKSILNMLCKIGVKAIISSKGEDIERADKLILPGVGAFDSSMQNLNNLGIVEVLNRESNQTSQLLKSKKITSLSDGTLTVENISPQDLEYLKEIQLESGVQIEEIESEQEDLDETGSLDEGTVQELVIILTNADGEEKKLIIKFTE